MNFTELLGTIKRSFKSHDSSGLLDDQSIYEWYLDSLKPFGALPYELYEEIVEVKNGQAKLPAGFRKLVYAVKCEPYTYKTESKKHLQNSVFWKERHEKTAVWDSCDDCCVEEYEKFIVENIYYGEHSTKYFYKNPELLTLTEGVNKNIIDNSCINKKSLSKFEINIVGVKGFKQTLKRVIYYLGIGDSAKTRMDLLKFPRHLMGT